MFNKITTHSKQDLNNMNTSRKYMIFLIIELNKIDFNEVLETSSDSIRRSIDQTKTFVKWYGDVIPTSVNSLTTKEGPYTHAEILSILDNNEWSTNDQT